MADEGTSTDTEGEAPASLLKDCLLNYLWSDAATDLAIIKAGLIIRSESLAHRMKSANFSDVMAGLAATFDSEAGEDHWDLDQPSNPKPTVSEEKEEEHGYVSKGNAKDDEQMVEYYQLFGGTDQMQGSRPEQHVDDNCNVLLIMKDASTVFDRITEIYRHYIWSWDQNTLKTLNLPVFPLLNAEDGTPLSSSEKFTDLMNFVENITRATHSIDSPISRNSADKLLQQLKMMNYVAVAEQPILAETEQPILVETEQPILKQKREIPTPLDIPAVEENEEKDKEDGDVNVFSDLAGLCKNIMHIWSIPDENMKHITEDNQPSISSDGSSLSLSFTSFDPFNHEASKDLDLISMDLSFGWTDQDAEPSEIINHVLESEPSYIGGSDILRTSTPDDEDFPEFDQCCEGCLYPSLSTDRSSDCQSRRRLWDLEDNRDCDALDGVAPLSRKSTSEPGLPDTTKQDKLYRKSSMNDLTRSTGSLKPFSTFPSVEFNKASTNQIASSVNPPLSMYTVSRPQQDLCYQASSHPRRPPVGVNHPFSSQARSNMNPVPLGPHDGLLPHPDPSYQTAYQNAYSHVQQPIHPPHYHHPNPCNRAPFTFQAATLWPETKPVMIHTYPTLNYPQVAQPSLQFQYGPYQQGNGLRQRNTGFTQPPQRYSSVQYSQYPSLNNSYAGNSGKQQGLLAFPPTGIAAANSSHLQSKIQQWQFRRAAVIQQNLAAAQPRLSQPYQGAPFYWSNQQMGFIQGDNNRLRLRSQFWPQQQLNNHQIVKEQHLQQAMHLASVFPRVNDVESDNLIFRQC